MGLDGVVDDRQVTVQQVQRRLGRMCSSQCGVATHVREQRRDEAPNAAEGDGGRITEHFRGSQEPGEWFSFCLVGVFLWAMACFVLWHGFIVPRFRQMTRREELFHPEKQAPRPKREPLVTPTLVEEAAPPETSVQGEIEK